MASGNKTAGDRKSKISKAGKRHGQTCYPAPLSKERQTARERGEQQFISKKPLTVDLERTVIVFNQKTGLFEYKSVTVSSNTECKFDPSRGRVIYTPSFKEKEKNNCG